VPIGWQGAAMSGDPTNLGYPIPTFGHRIDTDRDGCLGCAMYELRESGMRAEVARLVSELAAYRQAVIPRGDYDRVCQQRDEALALVDMLSQSFAEARDAGLDRALDVMADVIKHYGRDIESSYSTYEKQGAWRAMQAVMVEAGR
jgi:hypothetical protein